LLFDVVFYVITHAELLKFAVLSIDYDLSGVFDQSPLRYMGLLGAGFKFWEELFDRGFLYPGAGEGAIPALKRG
jgi:hypothetical protein